MFVTDRPLSGSRLSGSQLCGTQGLAPATPARIGPRAPLSIGSARRGSNPLALVIFLLAWAALIALIFAPHDWFRPAGGDIVQGGTVLMVRNAQG